MRSLRRERRPLGFRARRTSLATYAGAGSADRAFLSNALDWDRTDGRLQFAADSRLAYVAQDYEAWVFSLAILSQGNVAAGETVSVSVVHAPAAATGVTLYMAALVSGSTSNNYRIGGAIAVDLAPGDTITPQYGSGLAGGNNPNVGSYFSGVRVG